jgi:hypothetical protein
MIAVRNSENGGGTILDLEEIIFDQAGRGVVIKYLSSDHKQVEETQDQPA